MKLEHIGLRSRAKTHVGRGSGARMADLGGASEAQIRRLGRWNNQAMEKCYLTSLPREAMRTLAGFEPGRGSYYLVRSCIDPPLELQKQIFPMVEDWQSKNANGACEQSIAAGGFLELLQYLRIVILQDAFILSEKNPGHPLWKHEIFQCAEFTRFQADLNTAMINTDDPTERQLEKAMPVLKVTLDGIHKDLKASVNGVRTSIETIEGSLADVVSMLAPLSGGSTLLEVKIVNGANTTNPISTPPIPETCAMVGTTSDNREIAKYRLSRGIQTIRELWTEWVDGLPGGIAVEKLEEQFGTKWCSNLERRFFNRRSKIIDLVKNTALAVSESKGIDSRRALDEVIDCVDSIRTIRKKSLNWVSQNADEIAREITTQRPPIDTEV